MAWFAYHRQNPVVLTHQPNYALLKISVNESMVFRDCTKFEVVLFRKSRF